MVPSAHAIDRAVFHCSTCQADRVGFLREGPWHSSSEIIEMVGNYVECSGCLSQVSPMSAMNSVIESDFAFRMREGSRALLATIILSGRRTATGIAMAIDTIEIFSGLSFSINEFMEDMDDEALPNRFRGDLILLAENLRSPGASTLLRAAIGVAELSGGLNDQQRLVIEDAGAHLRLVNALVRRLFD